MAASALPAVYQLRICLCEISPLIWRRLLVRSDTSIAELHHLIQAAFDWSDSHLHRFVIHGKDYGSAYVGGISFRDDPKLVRLADFGFRRNERCFYEYDFYDLWRHAIRLEQILPFDPPQCYPRCIGGKRAAPPEDCGGPQAFLALRQRCSIFHITQRLLALSSLRIATTPRQSWTRCATGLGLITLIAVASITNYARRVWSERP